MKVPRATIRRRRQRRVHVALDHPAADQHVVGSERVQRRAWRRAAPRSMSRTGSCGCHSIGSSASGIAITACVFADQREHRLAAKAHLPVGQHRLILDLREDAEAVLGHVAAVRTSTNPGCRGSHARRSPMRKRRARVRRADHAQPQRSRRRSVGTEALAAGDLGSTVQLGDARADRRPGRRLRRSPLRRARRRAPPRRSCGSRCSGTARRPSASSTCCFGGIGMARQQRRWRPSACPACRCRTAPHRARGTRAAGGTARRRCASPSTVSHAPSLRPARRPPGRSRPGAPSSSTVQAPQSPALQPTLVPVRPSRSRSTSDSALAGMRDRPGTGSPFELRAADRRCSVAEARVIHRRAPAERAGPASAPRPAGRRRCRGRRRSELSAARSLGRTRLAQPATAGDRAGAPPAPGGAARPASKRRPLRRRRPRCPVRVEVERDGDHGNRDHQVAAGAELEKGRTRPRAALAGSERPSPARRAGARCGGCR